MAIKRIAQAEARERVALSMRTSTLDDLRLYCVFYRELYGDSIERNRLLEELVCQALERDVQFRAFKARTATNAPAA